MEGKKDVYKVDVAIKIAAERNILIDDPIINPFSPGVKALFIKAKEIKLRSYLEMLIF